MKPVAVLAFVLFVPFVSFAADLDAPLANSPITVRSEIERGLDLAPDPAWIPIRNYSQVVTDVLKVNQQSHDGFHFGLYYAAWHRLWSGLSSGLFHSDQQQRQAISTANYFQLMAVIFQRRLSLTDDDVRSVGAPYYIDGEETRWRDVVRTRAFREPKARHRARTR